MFWVHLPPPVRGPTSVSPVDFPQLIKSITKKRLVDITLLYFISCGFNLCSFPLFQIFYYSPSRLRIRCRAGMRINQLNKLAILPTQYAFYFVPSSAMVSLQDHHLLP